jgi:hypothetical protein
MTIHYRGKCIPVKDIECNVSTRTKWNKSQPYIVMIGFASNITIINDKAIIT